MVGSVTNFSRNGLSDWLLQRVTALIIIVYVAVSLVFICTHGAEYTSWLHFQRSITMRIFSLLFLLSLLIHAWIGIWTVLTDYANPAALRLVLQVAMVIFLFACLIWGLCLIF